MSRRNAVSAESGSRSAKTGESDVVQEVLLPAGWLRREIEEAERVMRRWREETGSE